MRFKWQFGFLVSLAAIFTIVFAFHESLAESPFLRVFVFDVGQGDALFLETPDRYQILIDGGPNAAILEKLSRALPFWDRSLDLVALTHPHLDHVAGLTSVLARYDVGAVLDTNAPYDTKEYEAWAAKKKERVSRVIEAHEGVKINAGKYLSLLVLTPARGAKIKTAHDANVVLEARYGKIILLFMGDAERDMEQRLIARRLLPNADFLKVGHHGSKTSTGEALLRAVRPGMGAISVGQGNRYGHPSPEALESLRQFGVRVFRTDLLGDLEFDSDGKTIYPVK